MRGFCDRQIDICDCRVAFATENCQLLNKGFIIDLSRYTGMDYVYQISMLQHKKKQIVLDSLSSYMSAYNTLFHQGTDLLNNSEPFLKELQGSLQEMTDTSAALEKQLEKRHTYVTQAENLDTTTLDTGTSQGKRDAVKIEGYLFKRGQKAFRTWNRRWFYLNSTKVITFFTS